MTSRLAASWSRALAGGPVPERRHGNAAAEQSREEIVEGVQEGGRRHSRHRLRHPLQLASPKRDGVWTRRSASSRCRHGTPAIWALMLDAGPLPPRQGLHELAVIMVTGGVRGARPSPRRKPPAFSMNRRATLGVDDKASATRRSRPLGIKKRATAKWGPDEELGPVAKSGGQCIPYAP